MDQEGGVDTAATATSAKSKTIRGELASTEVVDGRGGCRCQAGCRDDWRTEV